jgi:hypothetical protein
MSIIATFARVGRTSTGPAEQGSSRGYGIYGPHRAGPVYGTLDPAAR